MNSPDKIYAVFENFAKFKQIQIVSLAPNFENELKEVVIYFIFSKKIAGKCNIRLQSYTIHQKENLLL